MNVTSTQASANATNSSKSGSAQRASEPERAAAPAGQSETDWLDLSRFTVMLVDDDPLMLETVQAYLESYGCGRFVTTSDPRLAVDLLLRHRPDALLLDLMMPQITGFDILSQLRAHDELRYTPVIILTGESDTESRLKALELGATDFLTKPVDPSELVLRMRNVLAFKAYQDRLADSDWVTGLPNRRRLFAALTDALVTRQPATGCAVFHVDLDYFKQVNDSLGHRAGDQLLSAVGQRLEEIVASAHRSVGSAATQRPMCARIGGNGFGLLVPDLHDLTKLEDATGIARRILNAFAKPLHVDGQEVRISASVGCALAPGDGADAEALLKHAEVAMYMAKHRGRDTYAFFAKEQSARGSQKETLEAQLRRALQRSELRLYFQPKVELASGRVVGAEALVVWDHPQRGLMAPDKLLAAADEAGLTGEVDQWVLRAACAQLSLWNQQGLPPLTIAVNISPTQAQRGLIWDAVRGAVDRSGVLPQRLVIELSEPALMENAAGSAALLRQLNEMGVRLAIDDFGSGCSSFNYLSRFPLDELKIASSFIAGLPGDRASCRAVSAMIAMAERLDLKVIANGVEKGAQLEFLRAQGCHEYQGALCSQAVPAEPFAGIVKRSSGAGG